MTNYFGMARLIKIFYQYISDRSEYLKAFMKEVKEYGKDIMFEYRKHNGSEWLNCHNDGSQFELYATGGKNKILTMEEKKYDEKQEKYIKVKRILSYYDSKFSPYPENKDKSLDCYSISKKKGNLKSDVVGLNEKDCDVIFLDTETTGLNADTDEILQISIVNNNGDIILDSYICPEHKTEWKAAESINHISPQMLKYAPLMSDIAPLISEIMSRAKVVIAYNVSFDWNFIAKVLEKCGFDFANKTPELKCCMKKFAEVYGEWNDEMQDYRWQKLSRAASYYNIPWRGQAHGSLADTLMCRDVWNKMNDD